MVVSCGDNYSVDARMVVIIYIVEVDLDPFSVSINAHRARPLKLYIYIYLYIYLYIHMGHAKIFQKAASSRVVVDGECSRTAGPGPPSGLRPGLQVQLITYLPHPASK